MTFQKVRKILIQNGWKLVRTKGSHFQFKKQGVDFLATVPNHGGRDISIGVLKQLEKRTGLSLRN